MIANLGQTRRFSTAARTSLADVALRQLNYKDAGKLYEQALKGAKEDKRLDLMWPAQRGLGRSQWLLAAQEKDAKKATKLRESALDNYREAIATIETLQIRQLARRRIAHRVSGNDQRRFRRNRERARGDGAAVVARRRGPLSGPGAQLRRRGVQSYRAIARSRSLLDLLSETGASITEGIPAGLAQTQTGQPRSAAGDCRRTDGNQFGPRCEQEETVGSGRRPRETADCFDQIENQIRTASPRYAALTGGQPLTVAEIQQKVLDDQTVLLEYSLGTDASYLWAVSNAGLSLYKLPPRPALDKLATDFRAMLIPAKLQRRIVGIDVMADSGRGLGISATPFAEDAAAFVAASSALYKAVVEPVAAAIGEKRLLIVADGALNYVPFEALVKSA